MFKDALIKYKSDILFYGTLLVIILVMYLVLWFIIGGGNGINLSDLQT